MWVKLDDHFVDHPKVVAVGPLAAYLYIAGLCYANRFLTDGFIPNAQVTRLLPQNGHGPVKLSATLCSAGLWKNATLEGVDGFQIHDFLKYQPSKKQVLRDRKQTAKRQERWRGKLTADKRSSNGVTDS